MGLKSHHYKSFVWSMKFLRRICKSRIENDLDCSIIITGRRGKGKSTLAYMFLFGFEDFNPYEDICYTKEKMNQNLMKKGGFSHADEGVVNFSRGNTMTKGNKELYEILTKNRDNNKIITWCIPSIENVDKNILQYKCLWIHIIKRGVGVVFMPPKSSLFEKDVWRIDELKKRYEDFVKKNPKKEFPFWRYPIFKGWIKFGKLPKKYQKIVDKIKTEQKNLNTQTEEEIKKKKEEEEQEKKGKRKSYYKDLAEKIYYGDILSVKQLEDKLLEDERSLSNSRTKINQFLKIISKNPKRTISYYLKRKF